MERLLALVPRPRRHLVQYHGVRGNQVPVCGIGSFLRSMRMASGKGSTRAGCR